MNHLHPQRETAMQSPYQGPSDFLTPEQRLDAIAEILAAMALRALKQQHENHSDQT